MISITVNKAESRTSVRLLANPHATMSAAAATAVVSDLLAFSAVHAVALGARVTPSATAGKFFIQVDGDVELSQVAVREFVAMLRGWQTGTMVIEIVHAGRIVSHTFHTVAEEEVSGFTNMREMHANVLQHAEHLAPFHFI